MGWRITAADELARLRAAWPTPTVERALEVVGAEVEALAWASPYGRDFVGAWDACPRGDWLFMLALALAAGAEESRIPDHVARGFEEGALMAPFGTADELRRRIDGPALIRASLQG